jgi:hypothetical protein
MFSNIVPGSSFGVGTLWPIFAVRDSFYDHIFYNTPSLSTSEIAKVFHAMILGQYHEGGVLVVWPESRNQEIEYVSYSKTFHKQYQSNENDKDFVDTAVVPGVGSSPLGTAALARQVANIINRPVVGIIAGQGVLDMFSEGWAGWYDLGKYNRLQAFLNTMQLPWGKNSNEHAEKLKEEWDLKSSAGVLDEPDVNTLLNIMLRKMPSMIVGHSKGALVIQRACVLYEEEQKPKPGSLDNVQIVTFGCGIALPPKSCFTRISQFVGTWDLLGIGNTPLEIWGSKKIEKVERKVHSLSRFFPWHMPLPEKIAGVI